MTIVGYFSDTGQGPATTTMPQTPDGPTTCPERGKMTLTRLVAAWARGGLRPHADPSLPAAYADAERRRQPTPNSPAIAVPNM